MGSQLSGVSASHHLSPSSWWHAIETSYNHLFSKFVPINHVLIIIKKTFVHTSLNLNSCLTAFPRSVEEHPACTVHHVLQSQAGVKW